MSLTIKLILLVALLECCFYCFSEGFSHIELINGKKSSLSNSSCHCVNYDCGCCSHLDIPKIKLNNTACVNITYLPKDYGFSLTFSIDGKVYFNETVSARNPPPICFGVPYLEKHASICIHFYDLDVGVHKVHGCVKLEAHLEHFLVGEYDLGCFNFDFQLASSQSNGADQQECVCSATLLCNCCSYYSFDAVINKQICIKSQFLTSQQKSNISIILDNQDIGQTLLLDSGFFQKCFDVFTEHSLTLCLQYILLSQNNKNTACIDLAVSSHGRLKTVFNNTCFHFSDTWHSIYAILNKLIENSQHLGNDADLGQKIDMNKLELYNKTPEVIPFPGVEKQGQGPKSLQDPNFDFSCSCKSNNCSCCGTFIIEILQIHGSLCVSVQYLYKINSIFTRVVYSNILVMETTVPAAPSPAIMLFKIPYLPTVMDLGLSFSDVVIKSSCSLCMNLWLAVNHYAVGGMKIGCVNAPRMYTNSILL